MVLENQTKYLIENPSSSNLTVELITSSQGAQEITALEALVFNGEGEDIFTVVTLGKIGWMWGVRDEGQLIGGIEVFRQKDASKGFIHGLIVNPNYQYNGLGSQLIQYAEKQALVEGITTLECTIATTNGASLNAFINKSGYTADQFIPDCYGEGVHRLWVSRDMTKKPAIFDYEEMLGRQQKGEPVFFVEDGNYPTIQQLLQARDYMVVGVINGTKHEFGRNHLCIINKNIAR